VSTVYVDMSAVGRVLLEESDAPAIRRSLDAFDERLSSRLIQVELRRIALRAGLAHRADALLDGIDLIPLDDVVLEVAETIEPYNVGTLDAIHLATARRLARDGILDAVMTFDTRLAEGARRDGIIVVAPA
jgi:predicted nucleic acid-binding protein